MKKASAEKINKFANYGDPSKSKVEGTMILELFSGVVIFGLSYKPISSLLYVLPFVILSVTFYMILKKMKNPGVKEFNLFWGIEGIILSLTYQVGCFLVVPLTIIEKSKLLLSLIVMNSFVVGLMFLLTRYFITAEKIPAQKPVSIGVVAIGAMLGTVISRNAQGFSVMIIAFALASCISSVLSICIMKFYFAIKLEHAAEKNGKDESIGDNSLV